MVMVGEGGCMGLPCCSCMNLGSNARYSLQAGGNGMGLWGCSQSAVDKVWYNGHSRREPAVRAGAKCCVRPTTLESGSGEQVELRGEEV